MKMLKNERGVALVTSLMLTLISLGIVLALLYMIAQNIKMSGAQKRYRNSLEAAHGGARLTTEVFIPALFENYSGNRAALLTQFGASNGMQIPDNTKPGSSTNCFTDKLTKNTADWGNCTDAAKTANPKTAPDLTFTLKGLPSQPGFNVSTKIVDTQQGNSDTSGEEGLLSGSAVAGSASGVSPKHIPALYSIEVEAERQRNPQEKAQLSVLYAY